MIFYRSRISGRIVERMFREHGYVYFIFCDTPNVLTQCTEANWKMDFVPAAQ